MASTFSSSSSDGDSRTAPLDGLRVVEIGSFLACPLTARHLLDLGASVTAVVRPESARGQRAEQAWRPETTRALRSGKDVVTLDLKSPAGQEALDELLVAADAVVIGFAPAVCRRLRLTAERVHEVNPRAVLAHLPGFATGDAERSKIEAWEASILAEAGVFRDMGINRQLAGKLASYSPLPLASSYASIFAALGVVSALRKRTTLPPGAAPRLSLEVPLASALCDALVHNSLQHEVPEEYRSRRQRALDKQRAGEPLDYFETLELTDPFFSHYTTADARPFYLVAPCHLRHQRRAIAVLGIEKQVAALGVPLAATYAASAVGANAPRHGFGAGQIGDDWAPKLRKLMRRAFLTRTAYEWEAAFGAAGVPGSAHRTTAEWLTCPHARAAGLVREDESGAVSPAAMTWVVQQELPPPLPSPSLPSPCRSPEGRPSSADAAPHFGGGAGGAGRPAAVRPAAGWATRAEAAPAAPPPPPSPAAAWEGGRSGGGWMEGVEVLDLCNVIAGPTIGTMLARFGAKVTKVDSPRPTYSPEITVLYGLAANAGKRSVLLDVSPAEAAGRAAFEALVARVDVVVYNGTSDALERLGITPAELHRMNPNVVLSRFDAYGGPNEGKGERADHISYDDNLQAALGIMERFGGGLGRVEEHAHVGTIDVAAGVAGALATAATLLLRERRATGELPPAPPRSLLIARASLASVGQMVQFPFCCGPPAALAAEGDRSVDTPLNRGPECRGEHSLLHCYSTADGSWLLLVASLLPPLRMGEDELKTVLRHLSLADGRLHAALRPALERGVGGVSDAALEAAVGGALRAGPSASWWAERLGAVGVSAVPLASFDVLRESNILAAEDCTVDLGGSTFQFLRHGSHPLGSPLVMFAPCSVRTPGGRGLAVPLEDAPRYGEHTLEVLGELGVDPTLLLSRHAAATGWCDDYLPGKASQTLPDIPRPVLKTCPVCLDPIKRHVGLACSHWLCHDCAVRCSNAGLASCPVCRHPQLLDPVRLARRSVEWRAAYGSWRQGGVRGSKGEASSISSAAQAPARSLVTSAAGDLAKGSFRKWSGASLAHSSPIRAMKSCAAGLSLAEVREQELLRRRDSDASSARSSARLSAGSGRSPGAPRPAHELRDSLGSEVPTRPASRS